MLKMHLHNTCTVRIMQRVSSINAIISNRIMAIFLSKGHQMNTVYFFHFKWRSNNKIMNEFPYKMSASHLLCVQMFNRTFEPWFRYSCFPIVLQNGMQWELSRWEKLKVIGKCVSLSLAMIRMHAWKGLQDYPSIVFNCILNPSYFLSL